MTNPTYSRMVGYKQWADRGLYDVATAAFGKLDGNDATLLLRILDHMHVVDRIFRHHLQGLPHGLHAARSERTPGLEVLAKGVQETDSWYAQYVAGLSERELDEFVDFTFTSGKPARMRRSEMILHVCMHGTYHRGNAGLLLHKNGIAPNEDRVTDFLESAAA